MRSAEKGGERDDVETEVERVLEVAKQAGVVEEQDDEKGKTRKRIKLRLGKARNRRPNNRRMSRSRPCNSSGLSSRAGPEPSVAVAAGSRATSERIRGNPMENVESSSQVIPLGWLVASSS
jgi:hypothetical protein